MTTQERFERLRALLPTFVNPVFVIAQVDPDALGSNFGLVHLFAQLGVEAKVYYAGSIGQHASMAIVNRFALGSAMRPVRELKLENQTVCFSDSSSLHDRRLPFELRPEQVGLIVDHHRGCELEDGDSRMVWIDEGVGSASTLVYELVEAADLPLQPHDPVGMMLAMGIYNDTHDLIAASDRDSRAYHEVTRRSCDMSTLKQLIHHSLPSTYFDNFQTALLSRDRRRSTLVATVGRVPEEQGDDISIIANQLLRDPGLSLVVVYALIGSRVRLSARCKDISMDLNSYLRKRFGDQAGAKLTPDGHGEGGALLSIDLGDWMSEEIAPEVDAIAAKWIKRKIFG